MTPGLVSIIIPVFNHGRELNRCLDSCAAQTYHDTEIIVVDDGSEIPVTLPTSLIGDAPCGVLLRQENKGAPAARNRGFEASHGEYVIFCDADVVMKSTMLATLVTALAQHTHAVFAYSSFKFGFKTFSCGPFNAHRLMQGNYIHTTALMRRSAFPGFDPSLKRFQDWDLWLTIAETGNSGIFVNEVLFDVSPRASGMSRWLPSWAYHIPWLPAVKKFRAAENIIKKKHGIL